MKNYIASFLKEFEYSAPDSEIILRTFDKLDSDEWRELVFLYENNIYCDKHALIASAKEYAESIGVSPLTASLVLLICWTKRLEKAYDEQNIDLSIYRASVCDLGNKLDECKCVHGEVGIFCPEWLSLYFDISLVCLGRLQFELKSFERHYEKDGKVLSPESIVINTHIPRTKTPLSPEECDKAFARAAEFWGPKLNGETAFVCHSWLLFPDNRGMLKPSSNIVSFMNRFDIIEVDYNEDGHPNLWRLFDVKYEGDPDALPSDSSFRRAYIRHIKEGKKTGNGYGVFFYN